MRRGLTYAVALGAGIVLLIGAGIASAGSSVTFIVGKVEITVKGGFSPKKLPKDKLAPIHLKTNGSIRMTDGTHPPALKEVILETDKNGTVNAKGFQAKCTAAKLAART